ncbi:ornithine--oxo-acid transaminase [Saccharopolyspora shandongensis]|uniref:ornithine aminotransferase n=1 Tax=Saccharopolyspora shandongensis TaxID=418495 RepID=A0A1H3E3W2_9PSEU|nr:ornithine--oxo-acid transaminase [Saccharopolyspora shandongensis]SDX73413.1 ornithine--oxo-acid transaminase [Saccharopolyspora shandongensis]
MVAPETTAPAHDESAVARNYNPLPVVIAEASGAWMTDVEGNRYLDCLAGYSALNFGHGHPALLGAAREQLERLTLTSRAFNNDRLGPFCRDLAALAGKDLVLPMNTGAEAVETALKVARKWGYAVKGIPADQAGIVVAQDNFHGRTTTIVGFSNDSGARDGFGPFTPGFRAVPHGDLAALEAAIDEHTAAVLIEPIQGEAGVKLPPAGYLRQVRELCTRSNVLFVADEIQSGLGRTGATFACDHEEVVPDMYVLGKALGGGIVPVSAVVADHDVLDVIQPGNHGSTFGGNPLAAAVGHAVVGLLETGEYQDRARALGERLNAELQELVGSGVSEARVRGLWAGVDIDPGLMTGREACEKLAARGVLAKDTHGSTVRLSPPLTIEERDLAWMLDQFRAVVNGA